MKVFWNNEVRGLDKIVKVRKQLWIVIKTSVKQNFDKNDTKNLEMHLRFFNN